ncbi:hypothetical protein D4R71_08680 [bacterium]|nr:MAG: hypothetical protein D4R71_08680 [bacterium]
MHKVKFYSIYDMSVGHNLIQLLDVIKKIDNTKSENSINEIIEFYNITLFIKNNLFLTKWSEEEVQFIKDSNKQFKTIVNKYFSTITGSNLGQIFERIEWNYKDNFWEIIEMLNSFRNIHEDDFSVFLNQHNPDLRYILFNPKIVKHFDNTIKMYIMKNSKNTELLLDKFEIHSDNSKSMHFPPTLTISNKESLIQEYIGSKNLNLNYLRLITTIQSNKDKLEISDRIRLAAQKKIQEIEQKIFSNTHGFNIKSSVIFKEQKDDVIVKANPTLFEVSYNSYWIRENSDYSTLLNNFIYLFEFADLQMRITLVNKLSEMSTFERHIFMRSKNSYNTGLVYTRKDNISTLQFIGYYNQLERIDIFLEDIIKWFFDEYLSNEFNIKDFRIKIPSKESQYLEKCRSILPEMESALKQFNLYVEDGKIDHELLQLSTEHLLFKNCKSMIETKYIYPDSEEYNRVTFYLFSDQCMLAYVEKLSEKYKSFYELLRNETISIDDYPEYENPNLNWLFERKYIKVRNGKIEFTNLSQIIILRDLYNNEVTNYWRCPPALRSEIDEMIKKVY